MAGRNHRNFYGEGRNDLIPPNYDKKLEILRQGAEGVCYLPGHGCVQDVEKGRLLLERSGNCTLM